jgi:hypothetical protein
VTYYHIYNSFTGDGRSYSYYYKKIKNPLEQDSHASLPRGEASSPYFFLNNGGARKKNIFFLIIKLAFKNFYLGVPPA